MTEFAIAFVILFFWHTFGTSIGYHRLLTHRSVYCLRPVEYFFVIGGYLCLEGSPIWWATMHRAHHRYADTDLDPHTPRKGLRYAYNGWLNKRNYPPHLDPNKQCVDMINDPLYAYLEQGGDLRKASKLCLYINLAFRALVCVFFGPMVMLASFLAGITAHQMPLLINMLCHLDKAGYRNYKTEDDSVNAWWLSLLTVGESWHNNHHANPGSARFGLRFFEFDASWTLLKVLQALGLVKKIHEASYVAAESDIVANKEDFMVTKEDLTAQTAQTARTN